jgi:outer membrane protein assembly factor BamE (lipoprotein component of BamABCDE complex)
MRVLGVVALAAALCGCAIQRAQVAQDARVQMVGMSKEQVLACMGPPASKAAEAQTEVWGYNSGDGTVSCQRLRLRSRASGEWTDQSM